MPHVLISVECFDPKHRLGELDKALEQAFAGRCRVLDQAWVVKTDWTAKQVYDQVVRSHLDPTKDKCVLAPLDGEWIAHNTLTRAKCRNLE